ncbi:unnamed protein product [Linum trigynum]|uniref:Uncharacterized protein n=1 Tax=Linum trigynum TaxID=586398 RepID=A0AAV2E8J3_9ROSI
MLERLAQSTDKGYSSMDLRIADPFYSTFLWESEVHLQHTVRLGGLVEQACAQLAHHRLLPFEGTEEVGEASHENFGRTSSDMDFQSLPPPSLSLEKKVAQACARHCLSQLEEEVEVGGEVNEDYWNKKYSAQKALRVRMIKSVSLETLITFRFPRATLKTKSRGKRMHGILPSKPCLKT